MPLSPEYFTADMVRALPDDGQRHEVVRGSLEAIIAPADVTWGEDTLAQPDVFVVPRALAVAGEAPPVPSLVLVAEVLSPSTARHDRFPKRALYQHQGVETIWLVDPEQRLVELWSPEASRPRVEREHVVWRTAARGDLALIDLRQLFSD